MKFFSQYRGLPKEIYYLCFVRLIAEIGLIFIMPYISVICTQRLGYTTIQTGYIMTVQSVGNLLGALLGGKMADTIGRRKTVLWMIFGVAAIEILAGLTCQSRILLVFMTIGFFANAAMIPASMAILVDLTDETNRNTAISLLFIFSNIGVAVGPILGGALFYAHMDWSFYCISIFFGASFLLMYAKIPEMNPKFQKNTALSEEAAHVEEAIPGEDSNATGEGTSIEESASTGEAADAALNGDAIAEGGNVAVPEPPAADPEQSDVDESDLSLWQVVIRRPILMVFLFGLFAAAFAYQEISYILPIQYTDMVGMEQSARLITLIWSGSGIIVILCTPFVMRFMARHTSLTNVTIGAFLYAAGFTLFALPPTYPPVLASTFIWTIGSIMINTDGATYIANNTPASHSGRSMSLFEFCRSAAKLTSPVICSYLLLITSYAGLWLGLSVLCLAITGLFLWLVRLEKRQETTLRK